MSRRKGYGRESVCALIAFTVLFASMIVALHSFTPLESGSNERLSEVPVHSLAYVSHPAITIVSDTDFAQQAVINSWPGDGTEGNPYWITGYEIDSSGIATAISIGNTIVHFVVSDCYLHSALASGIEILNATFGKLQNNTCDSNTWDNIVLVEARNCTIVNNTCLSSGYGIHLVNSVNNTIFENNVSDNGEGILLQSSSYNMISNNTCRLGKIVSGITKGDGIALYASDNNIIANNTCLSNKRNAIYLEASSRCTISENFGNGAYVRLTYGVYLDLSSNYNNLTSNSMINCDVSVQVSNSDRNRVLDTLCWGNIMAGIELQSSNNNTLDWNTCSAGGLNGIVAYSSNDNTISNNTCPGSKNEGGMSGSPGNGILLWSSINNTLINNTCLGNLGYGISIDVSDRTNVSNNNCSSNLAMFSSVRHPGAGMIVRDSSYCVISDNICLSNDDDGIILDGSEHNTITGNNCSLNVADGIFSVNGGNNSMLNNVCSFNLGRGILLGHSSFSVVTGTTCDSNRIAAIDVERSSGDVLKSNAMTECGITVLGTALTYWNTHDIDTTNTVNGKPVYYLKNQTGGVVSAGAGQVILANCIDKIVEFQDLSNASVGIQLGFSSNNNLRNNTCSDGQYGIYVQSSDGNTITGNGIFNNLHHGICILGGALNRIWNNTFAWNNGASTAYDPSCIQAYDDGTTNYWNSSDATRGNFWIDWQGPDVNHDGIVDVPYDIAGGSAKDYRPLTTPIAPLPPPQIPEFGMFGLVSLVVILGLLVSAGRRRSAMR